MNRFLQHRYLIRNNLLTLVGLCLFLYFGHHGVYGDRSLARLISISRSTETLSLEHDSLRRERIQLEQKVAMMRPGALQKDLLEERAQSVLGYSAPDDLVLLGR